ncbi:hypothetical protein HUN08_04830 [Gordonia sp. X0973]|uniref:hypothetical protein n=1 Tax=Gordonia sp. X0973 TaxID=2742602 RepID=UPI000F54BE89|nr:hypothetical protein [Gordonia sp. X0973]QKT06589.1 hypothetical protein HUN08_04830 [Gordonia sp. X0973]
MGTKKAFTTEATAPFFQVHPALCHALTTAVGATLTDPGNPIVADVPRSILKNRWRAKVSAGVREVGPGSVIDWNVDMAGTMHAAVIRDVLQAMPWPGFVTREEMPTAAVVESHAPRVERPELAPRIGPASQRVLVSVAFRSLDRPVPDPGAHGYVYLWNLPIAPQRGMRVIVPGYDGPAPAVVLGPGDPREVEGLEVVTVTRLATEQEIQAVTRQRALDKAAWLSMALKAAGLPTLTKVPPEVPSGFPDIAPIDGQAPDVSTADDYGRMWWRAYKTAERVGLPNEQVQKLRGIAHRWYAIRDRYSAGR